MALDHHDMDPTVEQVLAMGNTVKIESINLLSFWLMSCQTNQKLKVLYMNLKSVD